MFYVATALLESRGCSFRKHSAVISAFGKEFGATGLLPPEFHKFLSSAENARLIGDYLADEEPGTEDVELHLIRAEKFIEAAVTFLSERGKP